MALDHRPTPSFFIDKLLQKDPRKMADSQGEDICCSPGVNTDSQGQLQGQGEGQNIEVSGDIEICPTTAVTSSASSEFRGHPQATSMGNAAMTINPHPGYQTSGLCYVGNREELGGTGGGTTHVEVSSSAEGKYPCFGIAEGDREDREMAESQCHSQGHIQSHIQGQEHSAMAMQDDSKPDVDMNVGDDGKKRPRTAFSAEQVRSLEQEFQRSKYLSVSKRTEMSRQLGLTEQQIKIWFQNRRTKWKRKYTNNLEILAQQHYLRMGLLPAYPLHTPGGSTKPPNQYGGGLFGPNLTVRPAFPAPHQTTVRLYPPFTGPGLPRM